jgi:hypothetical protein
MKRTANRSPANPGGTILEGTSNERSETLQRWPNFVGFYLEQPRGAITP